MTLSNEHKITKTAVITGATGGIGKEVSAYFLNSGVTVYMLGRNFKKVRPFIAQFGKNNNANVHFCKVDFNNETKLIETIKLIKKERKIDFLIHTAAFYSHGEFKNSSISDLDKSYRVNMRAPYILSQEFLPQLISSKGVIIFINSSIVSLGGKKRLAQYASTKSALKSMADCIRQEVNSEGVRVFTIILGKTATPMQKKACECEDIPYEPEKMIHPREAAKIIYQMASVSDSMEITDLHIRPSISYE